MYTTGTREQLAAVLVNDSDSLPRPELQVFGTPGDWSVCVRNAHQNHLHTWLASARRTTQIRCFKTLDAAHAAAIAIAMLADPTSDAMHTTIGVTMRVRA